MTERTFYPFLMEVLRDHGASAVQEVQYNSVPDIQFRLGERDWLISVKIGEDASTLRSAFLQYLRHKEESGIGCGLLLMLPESVRLVPPEEDILRLVVRTSEVTTLIDADSVKEELRDRPFPDVMALVFREIMPAVLAEETRYSYSLGLVIAFLQEQVADLMSNVDLSEEEVLRVVTDRQLLSDIGQLTESESESVARFLAAYVFLSQLLFLRLLLTSHPTLSTIRIEEPKREALRQAFRDVCEVDYRSVYGIDVLDSIDDAYIEDTFRLIWGLAIEGIRYELPGRVFHALMPSKIRKMLAAFYTRPLAAEILAQLAIRESCASVLDPACGSGTILTAAYRRKALLFEREGFTSDPHRVFCQEQIFGADIMPFAVHLSGANLAAMSPGETLEYMLIVQSDSLDLTGDGYPVGLAQSLFPEVHTAEADSGEIYEVRFHPVDAVIMNPPFTKVERGIRRFANMERFRTLVGGEVGLWGHFIPLADTFLKEQGIFAAVLPINVLRGRESAKARRILFENWTPKYILKPTRNYGFSEWAEYRDILFIAEKSAPTPDDEIKFGLVKKNLTELTEADVRQIVELLGRETRTRDDPLIDIDTHAVSDVMQSFDNMMWFCGVTDFRYRDVLLDTYSRAAAVLRSFPDGYFKEGYRPVPRGVSRFLFLTRALTEARTQEAFLAFEDDSSETITATSRLGVSYEIEKESLRYSLRTAVGLETMDITDCLDYVAIRPYEEMRRVLRAAKARAPRTGFWEALRRELDRKETCIVIDRRINPASPSTHLIARFSSRLFSPSNQVSVIMEGNEQRAKAVCAVLNSVFFLSGFMLSKEESTGRRVDIRFYELYDMHLWPHDAQVPSLAQVFDKYASTPFPPLHAQLDTRFIGRYEEFWEDERVGEDSRLVRTVEEEVEPNQLRLDYDMAIAEALGIDISAEELAASYSAIVWDMVLTRRLTRD